MRKALRKMMALALAMVMVLSMSSIVAFAAEGAPADASISVSGLETGDKVNFYQVLKFDETAKTTGGWVNGTGFTLTDDQIQKILGIGDYAEGKSKHDQAGIDAALAATIANMAENTQAKFADVQESSGTATAATTEVGTAGLYVGIVTPGKPDYLYNPVFVGADYNSDNQSATHAAVTTLSYEPASLAKKEDVTLTKELTNVAQQAVNVGDDVDFKITSKVPAYSTAYQDPTYVITDTMESGLVVKDGFTPAVTVAGITLENTDYTVNVANDRLSFTVTMTPAGLAKVAATGTAQAITVEYKATVTSVEDATVTEKTNEATVKFSNNPNDSTKYSLLEDKTRTYSFTIDGNLLGKTGTSYETDELIKTGLNADGTPAFATKKYHSGTTTTDLSPLAGAKFALYKEEPAAADYASEDAAKASSKIYTNAVETDGIITSDPNGRLKIEGLDEGTYYLREVSAPTGFIADNRTFTITIDATYTEIEAGQYTNDDRIVVKYDAYKVLSGYTVTVNDGTNDTTSTYNITNTGETDHKVVDKATYTAATGENPDLAGDAVTPISNTKGAELPSTGGIGTTIFYLVGTILVLGAGILLITRRRMAAK